MIREVTIERHLVEQVRRLGGIAMKFVSPGYRGVPDRLILLDGEAVFVETKTPVGRLSPHQIKMHEILRDFGFRVFVAASREEVDEVVEQLS